MFKYYCYRHIRLDKNTPFYIGVGSKRKLVYKNFEQEYSRAYFTNRNQHWKNIIAKTNYYIEIVFESNSFEEIKNKEIEFILLYGRTDLNTGALVNKTVGGDGVGPISEETKEKLRRPKKNNTNSMKGKNWEEIFGNKVSEKMKQHLRIPKTKIIKEKRINSLFKNGKNKHSNETKEKISLGNLGKKRSDEWKRNLSEKTKGKKRSTPVKQYNLNDELIDEFKSIRSAYKITGISTTSIKTSLKENRSVDREFYWK